MKKHRKVDVSEQELEDLVRRNTDSTDPIEEGLTWVDHQKNTAGGRLDVLMVDSGKALVVAELKVTQDDGMLLQGLDYYDFVATRVESFARLYKAHSIDPTQQVRLLLLAPTFSQALVNRCKWLDIPVSLFTFSCLKFEGDNDIVPIFAEQPIPGHVEPPEVTNIEDHLNYITDATARKKASVFLDEIKSWKPDNISIDPVKSAISIKVNGRVFAYLYVLRQSYTIGTWYAADEWKNYPIKNDGDLATAKPIVKAAMERLIK